MGHDVLANNVFEQFGTNTCQGDRPVIRSSMPISLFENRGYISLDPFIVLVLVAEGKTRLFSQSMSGRLKSPPRMMVWFEFFGRRSKDLLNSSIFLIFEPGGR